MPTASPTTLRAQARAFVGKRPPFNSLRNHVCYYACPDLLIRITLALQRTLCLIPLLAAGAAGVASTRPRPRATTPYLPPALHHLHPLRHHPPPGAPTACPPAHQALRPAPCPTAVQLVTGPSTAGAARTGPATCPTCPGAVRGCTRTRGSQGTYHTPRGGMRCCLRRVQEVCGVCLWYGSPERQHTGPLGDRGGSLQH